MTTIERKPNKSIVLSTAAKNYNGAANTYFTTESVPYRKLADYLTQHNYSTIHWRNGSRKEANFIKAIGFVGDYDSGERTIQEVHDDLIAQGLNHLIIPSKSHTAEHHKFHVVLQFDHPVFSAEGYKQIAEYIVNDVLPGSDPAVTDAARYIYGSPENVDSIHYWKGADIMVVGLADIWTKSTDIMDKDSTAITASEVSVKTPVYCPFHEDSNPSAFIGFSKKSDNWYIRCSSCDETFWMQQDKSHLERVCEPYWSYGTDIWDFGMLSDTFFYEKLGNPKFHIQTKTEEGDDRKKAMRYLVNNKHIRHLSRIDYLSDIATDQSYYDVDLGTGVIAAHHRAIPVDVQDNAYVNQYLSDRFGVHDNFIKEWLAVFCHSNYAKLPSLIFSGGRGTGKSTFAEIVAEIFPTMSFQWSGNEEGFTYEVEKKLLIVEENLSDKVSQYKILKKYSGQKYATVKKKFKDPYQVRNNVNIILLSNELIPLFVSRDELPTNTRNNQFFVFEFPKLSGNIDPETQDKILARLGHYIRTELKITFEGLPSAGFRYSIDVPITDAERELFSANTTDLESDVDMLIHRLIDQYSNDTFPDDMPYYPFVEQGQLPVLWIKDYVQSTRHYNHVIKGMRRQRLLVGVTDRIQVDGKRLFCLTMTNKLIQMLGTPNKPKVVGVASSVAGNLFNQGA
ncbi:MAG: hypothetical protein HON27_01125 [Candidatus Marinimicrobia bacterium]|jgi:hypothetical protein|nr:hypothetical protein [Candidatus Neomarinimicrobiota bacterium]MBT4361947.1 hypothetical protein [Candidatus Neomarinimicrobiota bacterium]MBT4944750.1 hypothetical protein [Candidatus Neomarinimicrobiota bacterium]MBT6010482.1 hypothetical protein [Candidatus Neomarinimicrobiota bacterium]